jgi:hypothetical protein
MAFLMEGCREVAGPLGRLTDNVELISLVFFGEEGVEEIGGEHPHSSQNRA